MPTSSEFSGVATNLRNLVARLEEVSRPLENGMGAHVMEGGELTESVYESIKITRITAQQIGAVIDEYATEATRRATEAKAAEDAQEQYEKDLRNYEKAVNYRAQYEDAGPNNRGRMRIHARKIDVDLDGDPPTKPTPPPPPADYIDI